MCKVEIYNVVLSLEMKKVPQEPHITTTIKSERSLILKCFQILISSVVKPTRLYLDLYKYQPSQLHGDSMHFSKMCDIFFLFLFFFLPSSLQFSFAARLFLPPL